MQELYDIEKIKQLKARYLRALDTNDWALFGSTLTENCNAVYSDGRLVLDGREAIVGFMDKHMSGPKLLSMHHGHTPEIEITGDNTATGIWYLNDVVIDMKSKTQLTGAAIYSDEYVREDDGWKICKTGYSRTFEYYEPIPENRKILKNMFDSK